MTLFACEQADMGIVQQGDEQTEMLSDVRTHCAGTWWGWALAGIGLAGAAGTILFFDAQIKNEQAAHLLY